MEHSYSRDCRPIDGANGLKTRNLMIHRPPQCPSCHLHPNDENNDLDEANRPPTPTYNEKNAKELMTECARISSSVQNSNPDNVNWENCINMTLWTNDQTNLFNKVAKILDIDYLARLATTGKQNEAIQKRLIVDKSVKRIRKVFAKINWEMRLTQWLHETLINNLPSTYMAVYLDILQTLKTKLPQLMDKMLFGKPMNISQDLLAPVMKKKWEILLDKKERKLPGNVAIVIISSVHPSTGVISNRMRNWYELFSTMAQVVIVNTPAGSSVNKQPLQQITESLIQAAKTKIQELRNEQPMLNIVLLGFNAGAAVAIQIAHTENVNCVVCVGFACNTINGVRGAPDDHILDIIIPIMFVIGQNSARTSQEEIEALREKMKSETSLLVVGSADDVLRISKSKKQIENLTQSMVDSMVTDEIHEFIKSCICKPPGPRTPTSLIGNSFPQSGNTNQGRKSNANTSSNSNSNQNRKRKQSEDHYSDEQITPMKKHYHKSGQVGRPRSRPGNNVTPVKQQSRRQSPEPTSAEKLNMAIHTILQSPRSDEIKTKPDDNDTSTSFEQTVSQNSTSNYSKLPITSSPQVTTISTSGTNTITQRNPQQIQPTKLKFVPSNQFVQLKPPIQSQSKIYTIKTTSIPANSTTNSSSLIPVSGARSNMSSSAGQVQILPIKSPTSGPFLSNSTNQIILNPQKFTISKATTGAQEKTDISNIFDMPILFADNEGNLHDSTSKLSNASNTLSSGGQAKLLTLPSNLVIKPRSSNTQQNNTALKDNVSAMSSSQLSSGTFVLNPSTINKPKISGGSGKVVFINRNTMKPYPSIISKPAVSPMKYTKVVVTNPQTSSTSLVSRASGILDSSSSLSSNITQGATISISPKQQHLQVNSTNNTGIVKQIQQTSGILNCTTTASTSSTTTNKQYQVLLNLGSDSGGTKTTQSPVKNVIKMDASQINQTILLKTGNTVKQMPLLRTPPTSINKNLSIKKVMNFIPSGSGVGNNSIKTAERITSGDDNVISTITLPRTGLVVQPVTTTSVNNLIINKNQKKYSFNVNANVKDTK
ncbi:mucin-5AC isoform X1 [Condylostylus longicornis]|uniref:mucin-5AC isoform X1 n=1 Tax=Condylostylus longicornis TaxID=2530218 RepID=UPI00244DE29F|nr:mucin-5AC isoform X1 [Condylostylus longicornis]